MPRSPVSPVKLFYNARIITMDPSQPAAEAIAVSSDRILAVGKAEVLLYYPRDTQRIDLQGQVVCTRLQRQPYAPAPLGAGDDGCGSHGSPIR